MVLAARYQNRHHEAHRALIEARGKLCEDAVEELLRDAGIDVDRATRDFEIYSSAIETLLDSNRAQAEEFGFFGTPAFIIGGVGVPGAMNTAGFRRAIADARLVGGATSWYSASFVRVTKTRSATTMTVRSIGKNACV